MGVELKPHLFRWIKSGLFLQSFLCVCSSCASMSDLIAEHVVFEEIASYPPFLFKVYREAPLRRKPC